MKIGLALSGGGFRATVFHLGVLARLAEGNHLEDVAYISTVSGGSLCTGLVYAQSGFSWPSSSHYKDKVIPEAHKLLTTEDLQHGLIWRTLRSPLSILETRADDLSSLLQERWGITARLCDLARQPRWLINATCYETGRNWRFERFRMGDYQFGYSHDTNMPLADAMAASAGFPGLVGALSLDTRSYSWFKYKDNWRELKEPTDPDSDMQRATEPVPSPHPATVHLWDGGAYDNLGLESLHNFIEGWRQGVDFLIVSDASGRAKPEVYSPGVKALHRIITITMDQVRSLRSRAVWERFVNHRDAGVFLQVGNTCQGVLESAGRQSEIAQLGPQCLDDEEARRAADMETVIRRLTEEEYERLFRHGFEVADYTLYAYYPDQFKYIGYSNLHWR